MSQKIGIKLWNYGVRWQDGPKERMKSFSDLDSAKSFYEKQRKYLNRAVLFKYRPEHWYETFLRGHVVWGKFKVRISLLACLWLAGLAFVFIRRLF